MKDLWITSLFMLTLFPGCIIGPHYKRPQVPVPDRFDQQCNAGTNENFTDWWTFFKDPYLNKLIEKALVSNYTLRIAIEQIEYARDMYKVQFANLFPQVYVTSYINKTRYPKDVLSNAGLPKNTLPYFDAGFDAYWEIDVWGQLRHGINAAYDQYEAQIEYMHDVRIMLISDVAKSYIEIRSLECQIDLAQENIALNTQLLALSHDRFNAGLKSEIPADEQQVALDTAYNQVVALETAIAQIINRLAVLVGENPEDFKFCEGTHAVPRSTKKLEVGLPSELLLRRPDIREAERLLAAATEQVGYARGELFPKFFLLGWLSSDSTYGSNWFGSQSLAWSIGSLILWPMITFGRITYKIKAKESQEKQALLAYSQKVITALADVENALVNYFNTEKQLQILENKTCAATRKRDLVYDLFNSGLSNETDFLLAEQERIEVVSEFIETERMLSTALISVYKALGGGW
jgi:multidrug efflux system outer membrane protein